MGDIMNETNYASYVSVFIGCGISALLMGITTHRQVTDDVTKKLTQKLTPRSAIVMDVNGDSINDVVMYTGQNKPYIFIGQPGGQYKLLETAQKDQKTDLEKRVEAIFPPPGVGAYK
jgi:hypothetical protein